MSIQLPYAIGYPIHPLGTIKPSTDGLHRSLLELSGAFAFQASWFENIRGMDAPLPGIPITKLYWHFLLLNRCSKPFREPNLHDVMFDE